MPRALENRFKRINPTRALAWACALLLLFTTLPLYGIAFYNHPYYDDFTFSHAVHQAWQQSHSLVQVLRAAVSSSLEVRNLWQGTYTGTFLSNLQPGVFSENLYWLTTFVLLTSYLLCFGFFLKTVFRDVLKAGAAETVIIVSLYLFVTVQLMPSVGEAFYWFNGGIGNIFIYSLLALTLALMIRLAKAGRGAPWLMVALVMLTALLGGGSFGGGLYSLLIFGVAAAFAVARKHRYRFAYIGLLVWLLVCFLYSVSAPGNGVRASFFAAPPPAPVAVLKSVYYGVALIGGYFTLPVAAIALGLAPLLYRLAANSRFSFRYPVPVFAAGVLLFCAQLTPPLYAGVFLGGDRTVDTYYVTFVMMLLLYETYLLGWVARRREQMNKKPLALAEGAQRGLLIACACLLTVGCLGYKQPGDTLYGPMNMAGGSAALSIASGEAKVYDREMQAREALLNDAQKPVITLKPLTAVPRVFMEDLLRPDAQYNVLPVLCRYYGKTEIMLQGGDAP